MCLDDRPILEANAAGIDIGAREIFIAVPPDRDEKPVRVFSTFTEDLEKMAQWLVSCGITTVAMESTGVYWIPLYDAVEQHGIKACLVDARGMKNVPGRPRQSITGGKPQSQGKGKKGGTKPAKRCERPPPRRTTATALSAHITVGSPPGRAPMWRSLPRPKSWQPSSIGCSAGAKLMSMKGPRPTKNATNPRAFIACKLRPTNSAINFSHKRPREEPLTD